MRKQIIFQQCNTTHCLINIKNIFGFLINYIQDKIKKQNGKWNPHSKKFQLPITNIPLLAKQLQTIDRTFFIQQLPTPLTQLLSTCTHPKPKIKKQLLIDPSSITRYQYIEQHILKNILQSANKPPSSKNYTKILIICPQLKIQTWISHLPHQTIHKLTTSPNQLKQPLQSNTIYISSFQFIFNKIKQLHTFTFQTFIIDDAQLLSQKLTINQKPALHLKKILLDRHFIFPIITKLYLNKLDILKPLLQLMLPNINLQWFQRRYKKQNIQQLKFIVNHCFPIRQITKLNPKQSSTSPKHFFNKLILQISQQSIQKIKLLNKKNPQLEHKRLLQNPQLSKNKTQKFYLHSIITTLQLQKIQNICQHISFMTQDLNLKLAIIIQSSTIYRTIENYLCSHQISYCHYEHHLHLLDFNKNPTILVCLIKLDHLLSINFSQSIQTNDQSINTKLSNYQREQYLCLSGVKNILFPDIDWFTQIQRKQQSIRQLMRHSHGNLTRHYYILKGTYEQKWIKSLQDTIKNLHLRMISDTIDQDQNSFIKDNDNNDPTFTYNTLNLSKIQQQYSHLKIIKGIVDIDEQFDQLQFQALQQKLNKQSKKQIKQAKNKIKNLNNKQYYLIDTDSQKYYQKFNKTQYYYQSNIQQPLINVKTKNILQHLPQCQNKSNSENQFLTDGNHKKQQMRIQIKQMKDLSKPLKKPSPSPQKPKIQIVLSSGSELSFKNNYSDQSKQLKLDPLIQDQTDQVQIIQVRPAKPKQTIPKYKSSTLKVILHPTPIK